MLRCAAATPIGGCSPTSISSQREAVPVGNSVDKRPTNCGSLANPCTEIWGRASSRPLLQGSIRVTLWPVRGSVGPQLRCRSARQGWWRNLRARGWAMPFPGPFVRRRWLRPVAPCRGGSGHRDGGPGRSHQDLPSGLPGDRSVAGVSRQESGLRASPCPWAGSGVAAGGSVEDRQAARRTEPLCPRGLVAGWAPVVL